MQKIGVFTSGGDAPGMNAAIRAVVRTCAYNNIQAYGIYEGYKGLIPGNVVGLGARDVKNIIQRGEPMLHGARCKAFHEYAYRNKAYAPSPPFGLDGIV